MNEQPRTPLIGRGELMSALSALVLLALMFLTAWYGVDQLPSRFLAGAGRATSETAWQGLTIVRWVMLLTIVVALGSVIVHLTQRSHGNQTDTGGLIAMLGTVTFALLIYRVLIALPTPYKVVDQKVGAMLGLLCALGIAVGGLESMREERVRAGRLVQRSKGRLASDGTAR
jgi:hypothetical protein